MGNEWTEFKINSIEELLERVSRVLETVKQFIDLLQSLFVLCLPV